MGLAGQEKAVLSAPDNGHTSGRESRSSLQGSGRQLVHHIVENPRGGEGPHLRQDDVGCERPGSVR